MCSNFSILHTFSPIHVYLLVQLLASQVIPFSFFSRWMQFINFDYVLFLLAICVWYIFLLYLVQCDLICCLSLSIRLLTGEDISNMECQVMGNTRLWKIQVKMPTPENQESNLNGKKSFQRQKSKYEYYRVKFGGVTCLVSIGGDGWKWPFFSHFVFSVYF